MSRSDAEIVAHLRRELRAWTHSEACPGEGDCTCGLSRIVDIAWPPSDLAAPGVTGWQPGKFQVRHWRLGDLVDGEAFVLVPERDPAAVEAIVAYAKSTPDVDLAEHLLAWARRLRAEVDGLGPVDPADVTPSWVLTLAEEVRSGRMSVETALSRIVGLVRRR